MTKEELISHLEQYPSHYDVQIISYDSDEDEYKEVVDIYTSHITKQIFLVIP